MSQNELRELLDALELIPCESCEKYFKKELLTNKEKYFALCNILYELTLTVCANCVKEEITRKAIKKYEHRWKKL